MGSGNSQFNNPFGLAADAEGNLFVADTGNNRIQKFSPKGQYLSQFGGKGSGNGQFSAPSRVAIDAAGNIWVADTGNNRIEKFSAAGNYLSQFGASGSGNGQLNYPSGIAFDAAGDIWIADGHNNRIQEFSPSGQYLSQFGESGSAAGQLNFPAGLTIDHDGNIWVVDSTNDRIQVFSPEGEYLAQFGEAGSGEGQLNDPYGIAMDPDGDMWIADSHNNRLQKWQVPHQTADYSTDFGAAGSGDGQLSSPVGLTSDQKGNIWVADTFNNRVEGFSPKGAFLSRFGEKGSGNGQLSSPRGLAVDTAGNFFVADTGNNRIEKFGPDGKYLAQFGGVGSGNGQLSAPSRVAIDAGGNIWVADSGNNRIQKFSAAGSYLSQFGASGSGNGQLNYPSGIAFDAAGDIWIADGHNNRIQEFSPSGQYLSQFGESGSGEGQLNFPSGLSIDHNGNIWVVDSANNRIQVFRSDGEYLAQFGEAGSGEDQLSSPYGIAADPEGNIWIADTLNNRLQKWEVPHETQAEEAHLALEDDPKVEVDTSGGLVESVEGEEAGEHGYEHEGDLLTAVQGPEGETSYEYDSEHRLTKVQLPNGTTGEITYSPIGRVTKVTVAPEGSNPKSAYFEYSDEPRRTTVTREGEPVTTYDIGADGSVFKWWNSPVPPEFDDLAGSLYAGRETSEPIATGDHQLLIQAHSEHGIASIEVIANGNQLVDEKSCDLKLEVSECKTVPDVWVTETGNWPPGILYLEVIATDRLEHMASERFWVNIPYTPPPVPGAIEPPKFKEILNFREEFGLDLDLKGNEIAIAERIFNLIGDWHNPQTPEGEIARATDERWGVPLRAVDAAEMGYRETYIAQNVPLIEEWAESNAPGTYAGYQVDHRHGGIVHIGFTQNQAGTLAALLHQLSLMAPDRIAAFDALPTSPRISLQTTLDAVESAWSTNGTLANLIVEAGIDEPSNTVRVGATDTNQVENLLASALGPQAPVSIVYETEGEPFAGRNRISGRMLAGDRIINDRPTGCTAGYGAWEPQTDKPSGQLIVASFLLAAGHCASVGEHIWRAPSAAPVKSELRSIGVVKRTGAPEGGQHYETDASAVRLNSVGLVPFGIYRNGEDSRPVGSAGTARTGEILCFSGSSTNGIKCGSMVGVRRRKFENPGRNLFIITRFAGIPGDSGAPVWNPRTGDSIGMLSGGPNDGRSKAWVTPLVVPRGFPVEKAPGALRAPGMGLLNLMEGG